MPILILYFECEMSDFISMFRRLHRSSRLSVVFRERTVAPVCSEAQRLNAELSFTPPERHCFPVCTLLLAALTFSGRGTFLLTFFQKSSF